MAFTVRNTYGTSVEGRSVSTGYHLEMNDFDRGNANAFLGVEEAQKLRDDLDDFVGPDNKHYRDVRDLCLDTIHGDETTLHFQSEDRPVDVELSEAQMLHLYRQLGKELEI